MVHQTQLTVSGANGVHGRHVRRRHRVSGEVLDQGVVGQDDDVEDVHEDVGHNDGVDDFAQGVGKDDGVGDDIDEVDQDCDDSIFQESNLCNTLSSWY